MEPFQVLALDGEGDQLVQPRQQPPGSIPAQVQYLGRFGVHLSREVVGVEAVVQDRGVLPEELIQRHVGVDVDRRIGDPPLGFDAEQHARPQQHRVAKADGLLSELAEHDGRAVTDHNEPDNVVRRQAHRSMRRPCPSRQRRGDAPIHSSGAFLSVHWAMR